MVGFCEYEKTKVGFSIFETYNLFRVRLLLNQAYLVYFLFWNEALKYRHRQFEYQHNAGVCTPKHYLKSLVLTTFSLDVQLIFLKDYIL